MALLKTTVTAILFLTTLGVQAAIAADAPAGSASSGPVVTINPAPANPTLANPVSGASLMGPTVDNDPGANLGKMVDGYRTSKHAIGVMLRSIDDPMLVQALTQETLSDEAKRQAVGAVVAEKRKVAKAVLAGELDEAFSEMMPKYDSVAAIQPLRFSKHYRGLLVEWRGLAREYTEAYLHVFDSVDAFYAVFNAGGGVASDPAVKAAYAKYSEEISAAEAEVQTIRRDIGRLREAERPPTLAHD